MGQVIQFEPLQTSKNVAKARIKLTEQRILTLVKPKRGAAYVYDTAAPSLAVRITKGGTRTFVVVKKVHGTTHRLTLGRFPGLRLEDARRAAESITGELAQGKDPIAGRKAARMRKFTLSDLWPLYLAHLKRRNRTWKRDESRWKTRSSRHSAGEHLPKFPVQNVRPSWTV